MLLPPPAGRLPLRLLPLLGRGSMGGIGGVLLLLLLLLPPAVPPAGKATRPLWPRAGMMSMTGA